MAWLLLCFGLLAGLAALMLRAEWAQPSSEPVAVYSAHHLSSPLTRSSSRHSAPAVSWAFHATNSSSAGWRSSARSGESAARPTFARTNGPFYGDLNQKGELERAVRLVQWRGEIILLHGDAGRFRMLVNLVANLNDLGIFHILLLGFSNSICSVLRLAEAHASSLTSADTTHDMQAPL